MKKFMIIIFIMAFVLAGCAIADLPFFEGWSAEQLVIGCVTVLITISQATIPKISILQWIKKIFRVEDELAFYIVMVFFFGLSALALWVTGEFDPTVEFTMSKVVFYYGILLSISQAAYQRLKASTGRSGMSLLP